MTDRILREFRATLKELPQREVKGTEAEATWLERARQLRKAGLNQDPYTFLDWHVIRSTMYPVDVSWGIVEFTSLRKRRDWRRWRKVIRESGIGNPAVWYPIARFQTSVNLIRQAYHLAQFEDKTGVHVENLDYIFEYGGGYGCMCKMIHDLGFEGRYVLYDLPEFLALQRFYLETVEVQGNIVYISDIPPAQWIPSSLFIAILSLNEAPLYQRAEILPFLSSFQYCLINYHSEFRGIDNAAYFDGLVRTLRNVRWHHWETEHVKCLDASAIYLVGGR